MGVHPHLLSCAPLGLGFFGVDCPRACFAAPWATCLRPHSRALAGGLWADECKVCGPDLEDFGTQKGRRIRGFKGTKGIACCGTGARGSGPRIVIAGAWFFLGSTAPGLASLRPGLRAFAPIWGLGPRVCGQTNVRSVDSTYRAIEVAYGFKEFFLTRFSFLAGTGCGGKMLIYS